MKKYKVQINKIFEVEAENEQEARRELINELVKFINKKTYLVYFEEV